MLLGVRSLLGVDGVIVVGVFWGLEVCWVGFVGFYGSFEFFLVAECMHAAFVSPLKLYFLIPFFSRNSPKNQKIFCKKTINKQQQQQLKLRHKR